MACDLSSSETAEKLMLWSEAKSKLRPARMLVLGLMAGAFIGLGALFFVAVMIDAPLGHGPTRTIGGWLSPWDFCLSA